MALSNGQDQADTGHWGLDTGITGARYAVAEDNVKSSGSRLLHKIKNRKSILALAASDSRIYAGTQDGEILVSISTLITIDLNLTLGGRFGPWKHTSYKVLLRPMEVAYSAFFFLRMEGFFCLALATPLSTYEMSSVVFRLLLPFPRRYGAPGSSNDYIQFIQNMMSVTFSALCIPLSYKRFIWGRKIQAYKQVH